MESARSTTNANVVSWNWPYEVVMSVSAFLHSTKNLTTVVLVPGRMVAVSLAPRGMAHDGGMSLMSTRYVAGFTEKIDVSRAEAKKVVSTLSTPDSSVRWNRYGPRWVTASGASTIATTARYGGCGPAATRLSVAHESVGSTSSATAISPLARRYRDRRTAGSRNMTTAKVPSPH